MATGTRHPTAAPAPAAQLLPDRRTRRAFPQHPFGEPGRKAPEAIEEPRVSPIAAVAARDRRYRRNLAYADVAAATLAVLVTLLALGHDGLNLTMLLLVPVIVVASKARGLYDLHARAVAARRRPDRRRARARGRCSSSGRRCSARRCWRAWPRAGLPRDRSEPERCLFIGDAGSYAQLKSKVGAGDGVEFVGRMSLQRIARRGARTHDTDEVTKLIGWANAHRLVMEAETLPALEMMELVRAAKSVGTRVSLVPRVFDVIGSSVVFDERNGMTVLGVRRFGLTRSSRRLKRVSDLVSATVLIVAAAPLLALIALAIKLDTRGPVLFRQTRIGRNGIPFRICKFRTMVADDPRVTRVGSMSLVGPRPLIADEDERVKGYDRHRLQLTPGMTGHWQVLGSSRVPLPEMLKIDYLHVAAGRCGPI